MESEEYGVATMKVSRGNARTGVDGHDATECCFFFSSRRRHTRFDCDWSSDVCSSDLPRLLMLGAQPRQGVGMCSYTSRAAALALLVGALACSDRPPGTAPDAAGGPNLLSTATNPEFLARSLALALGDPVFRAHVKDDLDRSPFREIGRASCRER